MPVREPFVLYYNITGDQEVIISLYLGASKGIRIYWEGVIHVVEDSNEPLPRCFLHTFAPGKYKIQIVGTSETSYLDSFGNENMATQGIEFLTSVNSFGNLGITSLAGAFLNAPNNFTVPAAIPSSVTNLSYMFANAQAFNQDIHIWNTANVSNMQSMFEAATAFNRDLSSWIISNVTDMTDMFTDSGVLTNTFDNMLHAWSLQPVQSDVRLDAPTRSSFSNSAYNALKYTHDWYIYAEVVTYVDEFNKCYNNTFIYENVDKKTVEGSTYQLFYGTKLLSTFIPTSASTTPVTTYIFNDVVINHVGILALTIQKVNSDNVEGNRQRQSVVTDKSLINTSYTVIDSVNITVVAFGFKEGSKILCFKNNAEKYVPIENVRKGDLVKTRFNGYVPVHMIGKLQMYHKKTNERRKEQLYTCSKEKFEGVFEDLVITGCHSILVDNFTSEKQREKAIETNNKRVFVTDRKYRLPACVDDRTRLYNKEGLHTIYHLALENDDYYMNYGIYANGLLVETTSKRYLKELSGMVMID